MKKSSSNKEEICIDCYNKSLEYNDKLATSLKEGKYFVVGKINWNTIIFHLGKLLFGVDFPIINETLQIDDSDEEDGNDGEMEYISDENFKFISENIDSILTETMEKYDLKSHMEQEREYLKMQAQKVDG